MTKPSSPVEVLKEIAAERQRQIEQGGFTEAHDDDHYTGDLARAAACYAVAEHDPLYTWVHGNDYRVLWPWEPQWWKPKDDYRRNLIIAAALLLAEVERYDRFTAYKQLQEEPKNG